MLVQAPPTTLSEPTPPWTSMRQGEGFGQSRPLGTKAPITNQMPSTTSANGQ
jgi:hypothetical protein